nr:probable inactive ATP-dependent zinc metalloprotease FTSHI 2, chloroplastic [Ipomoea batatas]GMC77510.1 probable inactive ATP-dependent zinc metalloprotease FTSHI 2, chloroplastic [Ipomoea batatas]
MTSRSTLTSSFLPALPSPSKPVYGNIVIPLRISCNFRNSEADEESNLSQNRLHLLNLSVTLTVISASLAKPSLAARVSERRRSGKKSEALTPQELEKWSRGLPTVSRRLPYTEILDLRREGKLRHIIKPPSVGLKQRPEVVLAVLEDSRVVRIVLPSAETDPKFWAQWDELKIDGLCMNAYSPPVKNTDVTYPYLGFLGRIPGWMFSFVKPKPQSKKALELKRVREEIMKSGKEEIERTRKERERMENAIKMQKKMEEKKNKRKLQEANYRKQKRDYEDRLKIQQAEAEEKKKIRELEREMEGIEGDAGEDEEGQKSEENEYMKMAMQFMKSGARVRRARSKRLPQYLETGVDVKFSDVAGLGKIRLELEEIVKFFTHGDMYRRRGIRIPGGILLCGPPGVGKTLLAKAVAGEAGVNFFSISASQFVEIYVGVGASRVRALYQEAKENAPSVVFIDELDAVGRERGLIKGSGGQERDATLNQLLVCLDGFEGRGEVITIASTNRPDILDPALVRPGRFDRKIYIPKPGLIGRVEILKVHARKKPMDPDVDYMAVASMTDGMVGAELANIIEVAAISMMRDGRKEITTDDLLQAAQIEERGMLERKERSPEMWKQVAVNQAATAVVAANFPDLKNVEFITIAPRAGTELGYVRMKMDHVKFQEGLLSRQSLLDHITVELAPRAADELWYGEGNLSTICAESADVARSAARTFVLGGLSDKNYGLSNFWTSDQINGIDLEALQILNMCYDRAKEILQQNQKLMDAVVDELVLKKSLSKKEFLNLVEMHGSLVPMPTSIVDLRLAKRLELQHILTEQK